METQYIFSCWKLLGGFAGFPAELYVITNMISMHTYLYVLENVTVIYECKIDEKTVLYSFRKYWFTTAPVD